MLDISTKYNEFSDQEKLVSRLISYPDGVQRILTMKQYQWDWIELGERQKYPFPELLQAAIELSEEFPSERGYHWDILDNTRFMLRMVAKAVHEETYPPLNDR